MNILPQPSETYTDYIGRELYIEKVNIGDNLGREVQGQIIDYDTNLPENYSCTLKIWEEIWRDRFKPQDPSKMKIG